MQELLNKIYLIDYKVDENLYKNFRDLFNDFNPLHTDELYAVEKGFKGIVVHGNILNGFLSNFIGENFGISNTIIHSQSIIFLKPVYLNSLLKLEAKITEVYDSVSTCLISYIFTNEEGVKVSKGKMQIGLI